MVRNADFVSSFCNDLVGDICGTVSGAAAAAIVFRIVSGRASLDGDALSVLMVALVAALTVGGKAAGKGYALANANHIVHRVALVLAAGQRGAGAVRRVFGMSGTRDRSSAQKRARRLGQEAKRRDG